MFGGAGDTDEDAAEENSSSGGRCSDDMSQAAPGDVKEAPPSRVLASSWSAGVPDVCCHAFKIKAQFEEDKLKTSK